MSKIFKFVGIVVIAIFNQSCSTDSLTESINESIIDGQWELAGTTEDGTAITLTDCDKMNTIQFINSSNEAIIETFNLIDDVCEMETISNETYTINVNTLTITNNPVYEIQRGGNKQTLILRSTQNGIAVVDTYNRL